MRRLEFKDCKVGMKVIGAENHGPIQIGKLYVITSVSANGCIRIGKDNEGWIPDRFTSSDEYIIDQVLVKYETI